MSADNFDNERHILATGYVFGELLLAGLQATPVLDRDGNLTPDIKLVFMQGSIFDGGLTATITIHPPTP